VIDHLGLMRIPKAERQDLALGEVTATLARIAKDLGITIFLLHQLNRAGENREDRRPRISELRDSGRIEQDSDCVWLLYRENYYTPGSGNEFEVIIGKDRNGPVGTAKLFFDPRIGRFEDLEGRYGS
jgi:replicative DNA helicase